MKSAAEQHLESDLPLDVYGRSRGYPSGDYLLLGTTPGTVEVPAGFVPVVCPRHLARDWQAYADLWRSKALPSVYLSEIREVDVLRHFIASAGGIRHIVADHCGWSLAYLTASPALEWLELHNEVQLSDIRCISQLHSLRGLVVKGCNNVFSTGIPEHNTLSVLVLRNIASLQNCHQLVEGIGSCFPSLEELQLNGVGYPGDALDLSPLQRLKSPVRLQAVGTRITDESGLFAAYCEERRMIQEYIDELPNDATEARLGWAAVHRDDLATLAEDRQYVKTLELCGCRDLTSLEHLADLTELSSLRIEHCSGLSSLASLPEVPALQRIAICGCTSVSDYRCLSSCRRLTRLTIKGGAGGELSQRQYAQQMASLHVELPVDCSFISDVSESELLAILKEVPEYLEAAKRELAYLGTDARHGGRYVN